MIMAMVFIGVMGMAVSCGFVSVRVNVGSIWGRIVRMPVVPIIVDVGMRMHHCFVAVPMRVVFGDVNPHADGHQSPRQE